MNTKFKNAIIATTVILLSACADTTYLNPPTQSSSGVETSRQSTDPNQKISAVGYGATTNANSSLAGGQQKLMAMRAARVDAYRNLAELVYGFKISGNTTVASFATQNDNIRAYVEAFIKGARLVNSTMLSDGTFEATVELDITPTFAACATNRVPVASCNTYN